MEGTARRYNAGKVRYELIPNEPLKYLAEVYTKGAEKYTDRDDKGNITYDGSDNWRKGMSWTSVLASVKRHLQAWEAGEDFDSDPKMNTHHLANASWGLFTLMEYMKLHPKFDDRKHKYLIRPKIGLDIDEVLADFVGAMMERFPEMTDRSVYWNDPHIIDNFNKVKNDESFWLGIKPKQTSLPFEPHCYITSRPIDVSVTQEWLKRCGFPMVKIYSLGHDVSKVQIAKEAGVDIFVDDRYDNFVELNQNGVCCYLYDAPHNQRHEVGYRRIKDLAELL